MSGRGLLPCAVSACALSALAALLAPCASAAPPQFGLFAGRPDATVDLDTAEGLALVRGAWRYADARVVPARARGPAADRSASGAEVATYDVVPRGGSAVADTSAWVPLVPGDLERRRCSSKLCFGWYRLALTLPVKVAGFDVAGSTAVLEIVADDYAEVWIDGKQAHALGQSGGNVIAGFNAPNRVVVTRAARPGQTIDIAVFVANGPLSDPPSNFIWVRSAALDFYRDPRRSPDAEQLLAIERRDPALDAVVPPGTRIERVAGGFTFTEGPAWSPDGALLFSDPNDNTIYRLTADGRVEIARPRSGYAAPDIGEYRQPGSNGLAFDSEGRLTICEHGRRRVTRIERNGAVTVLADRYKGRRLNSPNDLVYRSDGTLYFSDPPFGLPALHDDPRRELPHFGVYRLTPGGELTLLVDDLRGPNGVALSPDERFLYVGNWDEQRKVVMRYPVLPDGGLGGGAVFHDMTPAPGAEAIDGIEVDPSGNLFVSGPGGVWVLSPDGRHLGTLRPPEQPANFAWGEDGRTLFLAARTSVYRVRLP